LIDVRFLAERIRFGICYWKAIKERALRVERIGAADVVDNPTVIGN
jgi:hypothetical protein